MLQQKLVFPATTIIFQTRYPYHLSRRIVFQIFYQEIGVFSLTMMNIK